MKIRKLKNAGRVLFCMMVIALLGPNSTVFAADGTFDNLTVDQASVFNESGGAYDFRVEGDTDTDLFKIDGTSGEVSIMGGTSGVIRNKLFSVDGTEVKRAASISTTRTFDYDYENDFGIALDVGATRSGGVMPIYGQTSKIAITHDSTTTGVAGGSAATFQFQIGAPSGSGTVDIASVDGFFYNLNRRWDIDSALTYNVTNSYGARFVIRDGGSSTGGQVNVTNQYGAYFSDYISTGGTNRVNISNLYGLYVEPLSGAANNTLLALGGSATGNWSIYNNSDYDNYFAGDLGIGTTNPDSKLHVVGNGHITGDLTVGGNIAAKYQDLAEYVKTSETLTPGTVVMIDPNEINQVLPSDKEYNTMVAGVVSQMPGIILGEGGSDKAQIAHTGRVKVKVDTKHGGISIGDLLVTSPVKGHAMKANSEKLKPGMLLGKALEPFTEGQQGEILVLITLQ